MKQEDYLEEQVACYKLGRTKATLRKYIRDGKIRYKKEENRYFYNLEDVQRMLEQRLQKIIKKHSLTSDDITKIFLDTALLLMKNSDKEVYIIFYPSDEKINYQIVFEDELKNIKQKHHVLNFNKFISDGKHGSEGNYQIFATDTIEIIKKIKGVPRDQTPRDKINRHLKQRRTLENFIGLRDKRSFNADNVQLLLIWRKQLLLIFDDDFVEKQNIKVGYLICLNTDKLVSNNVFMLSQQTIDDLKNFKFKEIPELSGTVDRVYKNLNLKNNLLEDIEKIKRVIDSHNLEK